MKYSQEYFDNWHYRLKHQEQSESWLETILAGLCTLMIIACIYALVLMYQ
jgi:hypothetical protein